MRRNGHRRMAAPRRLFGQLRYVPCPSCVRRGVKPCKWFAFDVVSTTSGVWAAKVGETRNGPGGQPGAVHGLSAIEERRHAHGIAGS